MIEYIRYNDALIFGRKAVWRLEDFNSDVLKSREKLLLCEVLSSMCVVDRDS